MMIALLLQCSLGYSTSAQHLNYGEFVYIYSSASNSNAQYVSGVRSVTGENAIIIDEGTDSAIKDKTQYQWMVRKSPTERGSGPVQYGETVYLQSRTNRVKYLTGGRGPTGEVVQTNDADALGHTHRFLKWSFRLSPTERGNGPIELGAPIFLRHDFGQFLRVESSNLKTTSFNASSEEEYRWRILNRDLISEATPATAPLCEGGTDIHYDDVIYINFVGDGAGGAKSKFLSGTRGSGQSVQISDKDMNAGERKFINSYKWKIGKQDLTRSTSPVRYGDFITLKNVNGTFLAGGRGPEARGVLTNQKMEQNGELHRFMRWRIQKSTGDVGSGTVGSCDTFVLRHHFGGFLQSDTRFVQTSNPAQAKTHQFLWTVKQDQMAVLNYNVMLLAKTIFPNHRQDFRATEIPKVVSNTGTWDVIVINEAFDNASRQVLVNEFKRKGYPHATRVVDQPTNSEDGGVYIQSRWPILEEDQIVFANSNGLCTAIATADCISNKGVSYAKIQKNGRIYHIFGTHLQSSRGTVEALLRGEQIKQMQAFIQRKTNGSSDETIIISGDLNMDLAKDADELTNAQNRLNAEFVGSMPSGFTLDPVENGLAKYRYEDEPREWLDYIWAVKNNARPTQARSQVMKFRTSSTYNIPASTGPVENIPLLGDLFRAITDAADSGTDVKDLSDHYGLSVTYTF